jgi:hypothetical protein
VRPYTNQYKNVEKNKLAGKTKIPLIYYFVLTLISQFISSRASGDMMNNRRCSAAEPPDSTSHHPKALQGRHDEHQTITKTGVRRLRCASPPVIHNVAASAARNELID